MFDERYIYICLTKAHWEDWTLRREAADAASLCPVDKLHENNYSLTHIDIASRSTKQEPQMKKHRHINGLVD